MQITFKTYFSLAIFYINILGLLLLSNNAIHAAEKSVSNKEAIAQARSLIDDNIADIEVIQQTLDSLRTKFDTGKKSTTLNRTQIEDTLANIEIIQQTLGSMRREIDSSKENINLNRSNVQSIKEGLKHIEEQLHQAYSGLDQRQSGIANNAKTIDKLSKDLLIKAQEVRTTAADLVSQKSLIEDNSIRLYEILIKISSFGEQLENLSVALEGIQNTSQKSEIKVEVDNDINQLWRLLAIILTLFAPLAFILANNRQQYQALIEGVTQHQGALLACLGVFLGYFILGFGLMYGTSNSGWIGTSSYLLGTQTLDSSLQTSFPFTEFVLYQTGFIMLAAMIVYTAVGHQLSSTWHIFLALFVGTVLIPIFGHWAWAGYFVADNKGWLEGIGFIDQSGSIVINAVAAWFAFIIVLRLGRSAPPTEQAEEEFNNPVYSSSAIVLLWLGWLGFTTGTLPVTNGQISQVMLNVGLAGSAGGLTTYLLYTLFYSDKNRIAHGTGGFVAGLVAIAAGAQVVTFVEAAVIGISAGLLQNIAYGFLRKFFLKHVWQIRAAYIVAIHGVCGIWGALCVALLGTDGSFDAPNTLLLITQLKGIAAAIAYSFVLANIILLVLKFRRKNPQAAS